MRDASLWLLALEVIGLAAFPLAFLLFRFLPDRGYAFSKVLGLLLMSYLLWLGASAHLIPNQRWSIVLILVLIAVFSAALTLRHRGEIMDFLRARWPLVLFIEALFVAAFLVALYLHSYSYEIGGGEKEMSFAFINAAIRSDYFPAKDPWLSNHSLPYYYFGHIIIGALTNLVSIPSRITFNLAVASFAALTATASFAIVYTLVFAPGRWLRAVCLGLAATVFVLILSNMEGVFELLAAHSIGSEGFYDLLDIKGLEGPVPSTEWYPTRPWWIFSAVNFAYGGPNLRFPFYDFLLGELTPQVLALPVVLAILAVVLNLWRSGGPIDFRYLRSRPLATVLAAMVVGSLTFTHPWQVPTSLALLTLAVATRNYIAQRERRWTFIVSTGTFIVPFVLLSQLLFVAFFVTYRGTLPGLRPIEVAGLDPAALDSMVTRPHHFLYMWLPLLSLVVPFVLVLLTKHKPSPPVFIGAALPAVLPLLAWTSLISRHGPEGMGEEIAHRGAGWLTLLLVMVVLTFIALAFMGEVAHSRRTRQVSNTAVALTMAGVAVLLLLGAELFRIDTPVSEDRFDTLLRFNWEAWILLAIAAAAGLYYIQDGWPLKTFRARLGLGAWCGVAALVVLAGLTYPVTATFWRTDSFGGYRSLDGLASVKRYGPAEYEALEWLWDNVEGTPVLLEATGGSYTYAGRVSTATGLPTILGWPWHEFQWRGSWEPQAGRKEDVERAYTTTDPEETKAILAKYDVEYVYVGPLERDRYGDRGLAKFATFMEVAYRNEEVTIYRMPEEEG